MIWRRVKVMRGTFKTRENKNKMHTQKEITENKKNEVLKLLTTERELLKKAQTKIKDWTLPEGEFLRLQNAIKGYQKEIKKLERQFDKL